MQQPCPWAHAVLLDATRCPFGTWCPYTTGAAKGEPEILLGAAHVEARYTKGQCYYNLYSGDAVTKPPCGWTRVWCTMLVGDSACPDCGHYPAPDRRESPVRGVRVNAPGASSHK